MRPSSMAFSSIRRRRSFSPPAQLLTSGRSTPLSRSWAAMPEEAKPEIVQLADNFLSTLANERGSSPHTLRAYERELRDFAAFLVQTFGAGVAIRRIEHQHIRAYLG